MLFWKVTPPTPMGMVAETFVSDDALCSLHFCPPFPRQSPIPRQVRADADPGTDPERRRDQPAPGSRT